MYKKEVPTGRHILGHPRFDVSAVNFLLCPNLFHFCNELSIVLFQLRGIFLDI